MRLETQEPSETAEKVVFHKKLKIFGVLKCIIKQEMGLRSNSGGPFFYDYIDVLKKWTFSVISNRPPVTKTNNTLTHDCAGVGYQFGFPFSYGFSMPYSVSMTGTVT